MTNAAPVACPGGASLWAVFIVLFGFAVGALLGLTAASYEPVRQKARRLVGTALTVVGQLSVAASLLIDLFAVRKDDCGRMLGTASVLMEVLFFGGLIALLSSSVVAKATSWALAAMVAVLDASFVGVFAIEPIAHRVTLIAVLGTHGSCTALAAWWSWRARGRCPVDRAKASESARILTVAWAIFLVLGAASAGKTGSDRLLSDSVFGSLFVVGAITVVTGTGFTKYVEAMATPPPIPLPRTSGMIGRLRDRIVAATHAIREWSTGYKEFF